MQLTKKWSVYCIYWLPISSADNEVESNYDVSSGTCEEKGSRSGEGAKNTPIQKAYALKKDGSVSKRVPTLRTYVGISNNTDRRLRQHNGEIVGGAKYTTRTKGGVWKFAYIVSGFPNMSVAAQWEWRLHRKGTRLNKKCVVCNRVAILRKTAQMEKVTARAPLNTELNLTYTYPKGELPARIPREECVCFLK